MIQQLFCVVLSTDPCIPWAAQGCSPESPCFEANSWEGQRHSGPESEHPNWGVCRPHVFHREPEQTGVLYGSRKHWLLKLPPFWCILSLFELERNDCNSFHFCLFLEVLQGWTKTCADEGLRYVEAWIVGMFYIKQMCVLPPPLSLVCGVWRLRNIHISTPFFATVHIQLCICSSVIWKFSCFAMGFLSSSSPQSFFQKLSPKPLCSLEIHWCVGHICQFSFRALYWISPDRVLIRIRFLCVFAYVETFVSHTYFF